MIKTREEKRADSLELGTRLKMQRVEIRRALKAAECDPEPLILDPPECLRTTFVLDFVRWLPGVGPQRVRMLNRDAMGKHINMAVSLGEFAKAPVRALWLADTVSQMSRTAKLASRPQG